MTSTANSQGIWCCLEVSQAQHSLINQGSTNSPNYPSSSEVQLMICNPWHLASLASLDNQWRKEFLVSQYDLDEVPSIVLVHPFQAAAPKDANIHSSPIESTTCQSNWESLSSGGSFPETGTTNSQGIQCRSEVSQSQHRLMKQGSTNSPNCLLRPDIQLMICNPWH